jgi:hypothetical protein
MVFETLVCSPLGHLTWLIAQENFIKLQHNMKYDVTSLMLITMFLSMPNW